MARGQWAPPWHWFRLALRDHPQPVRFAASASPLPLSCLPRPSLTRTPRGFAARPVISCKFLATPTGCRQSCKLQDRQFTDKVFDHRHLYKVANEGGEVQFLISSNVILWFTRNVLYLSLLYLITHFTQLFKVFDISFTQHLRIAYLPFYYLPYITRHFIYLTFHLTPGALPAFICH